MALLIYSIKQFQLASKYPAILFSLLSHILRDHLFVPISPNCIHIISAGPQMPSPQLSFHFWMPLKNLPRRDALCDLDYPFGNHHRHTLHQKMNMILVTPNLNITYFKSSAYFQADVLQRLFHRFRENVSSIFCRTHNMVQQYCLVMSFDNMLAHRAYSNTYPGASSEEFFRLKMHP